MYLYVWMYALLVVQQMAGGRWQTGSYIRYLHYYAVLTYIVVDSMWGISR